MLCEMENGRLFVVDKQIKFNVTSTFGTKYVTGYSYVY